MTIDPEPPSSLLFQLYFIEFGDVIIYLLIIVLLFISGLISGSEVAFFSLTKKDIEENKDTYSNMEWIETLLKKKKLLLSTILIINNLVNIFLVLLMVEISSTFTFNQYNIDLFGSTFTLNLKVLFDIFIVTFLILLFGEIIPKVYAKKNPLQFANFSARFIGFCRKVFLPLSKPLLALTSDIEKRVAKDTFSADQLTQALELASEDESTTPDEQRILEGIINFGNTVTKQVMTPRVDMFALKIGTSFQEVLSHIKENGFSRIPVYENDMDQIKGVLYAKDLLGEIDNEAFNWEKIIREAYFVPDNKKLDDLLQDFQERKTHMAIVVNEYGGTQGLITLEDIIEEIVGDISDEYDTDENPYSKLNENTYVFEGKISLKDFYRIMDIDEVDENLFEEGKNEAESLAGFILEINEEMPQRNQRIQFHKYEFTIEAADRKRIKQIKVTRNTTEDEDK